MTKSLLLLLLVGLLPVSSRAQEPFLLFHKNSIREAKYYVGDEITFRIKDNDFKVTDEIVGFQDSLILFSGYEVHPEDITSLYVDDKTRIWFALRYKIVKLTMVAGAGYLILDVINSGEFDRRTMTISAALIGAGFLGKLLIRDRFKIKGKKKMVVID